MSDAAQRFLAIEYLSQASFRPLLESRVRIGRRTVDALAQIGLLDPDDARAWCARLERLQREPGGLPLLPDEIRAAARAYARQSDERDRELARHALEAVGALSWLDGDARPAEALIVDRVIPVPRQEPAELTITTVVLYADAVHVHWYDVEPAEEQRPQEAPGRGGPFELELADDRGTTFSAGSMGSGSSRRSATVGRTAFVPAPPAGAAWVEIRDRSMPLVRVPLT